MQRAGLGYEGLKKINPKLIMCSISFAGQTGPLSDKPGYDYIAQALAGITGVIGEPDGKPAQVPVAIGDASTGVAAAMAVGFALVHRERTGEGQFIEASLLDTYFHMHEANVPRSLFAATHSCRSARARCIRWRAGRRVRLRPWRVPGDLRAGASMAADGACAGPAGA